jgi:Chaperone of endosialidase
VSIAGLTTYALTTANGAPDQARNLVQNYTGALTGVCTVTLPNVPKVGYAINSTTGGFNVVLTAGAGTTAAIPPNGLWYLFSADGSGDVALVPVGVGAISTVGSLTVLGTATISTSTAIGTGGISTNAIAVSGNANFNGAISVTGNANIGGALSTGANITAPGAQIGVTTTIGSGGVSTNALTVGGNTNIGGSGTVGGSLNITGACTAASFTPTSDERLKLNDGPVAEEEARDVVLALSALWFRWRERPQGMQEAGFLAQEVYRVLPWLVVPGIGEKGDPDYRPWGMDGARMMPFVITYLQGVERRLAALEGR